MIDTYNDSSDRPFPTLDLETDQINLSELHAHVLRRNARVELVRRGESCVLMTRQELDSLEKALEILSNTDVVQALRDQIAVAAQLAATAPSALEFSSPGRASRLP